jgi:CRISPR-associated endonuclease Csn1
LSSATEALQKYVLGLDLGSASLGWAMVALDSANEPTALIRAGVRIFEPGVDGTSLDIEQGKDQSKAVDRRTARLHRRQLRRRVARQRELFQLLQRSDLLPVPESGCGASSEQRHKLLNELDQVIARRFKELGESASFGQMPLYLLRKRALDHPLEATELGRILFHLSQRRGFKSNRKEVKKSAKENEDLGQVKADIHALEKEMCDAGARTLGEYFAGLDPHIQKVRRRWTARKMFEEEFAAIWTAQQPHHISLLTDELREKIARLLFYQRPIAAQEHLIGKCELEPGKQRAPWATMAAQRFRILQKVNDLRLIESGNSISKPLDEEQRARLYRLLDREGTQTFAAIRKHLGIAKGIQLNLERGDEKDLRGNRTQKSMLKVFGDRWDTFSEGKQNQIIDNWRNSESDEALIREAVEHLGLDNDAATRLVAENPQSDYCSLSLTAIGKVIPLMQTGKSFKEAETEVYGSRFSGLKVHDTLPTVRQHLVSLRNPAVERALTEMRKVVNAIIREHGKPYEIRIELARELKKPRQERVQATKSNRKREVENKRVATMMVTECGLPPDPPRKDLEKAKLFLECGGICPYTGRSIPFSQLFQNSEFDVEHIIPRSRYPDDSFQNKTLCYLPENRENKRNRTPFEAYGGDEDRWAQILARVAKWSNPGKRDRFLLQDTQQLVAFSARQMNDTRYTSVLAGRLLETLYGGRDVIESGGTRQVIFASSGAVTATLRRSWGLEGILQELIPAESGQSRGKPRTDHRHHAIDAITIALTRSSVIQAMAQAASLEPWQEDSRAWRRITSPWKDFVGSIRPHIEQMVVSHRPEHKISGELHKGSNYARPYIYQGKATVHTRCSIASLKVADIEADDTIVDPAVRNAIRSKLEELGGNPKLFEKPEDAPCLQSVDGRTIPIRKVRIRETRNPVKVGQGMRERFVASGGIHHVAFFVVRGPNRKEKWDSRVVQITDAYERRRRKLPVVSRELATIPDAEFLFSVMKDDTVEVSDPKGTRVLRVKKFNDQKQMWFVPVNDAHDDGQQMKLGIAWSKKPSGLKDLCPRKVVVDLLGKVHAAND